MWLKASTARQPGIRLTELIPGSVYHFRVKAENPYGVSEPSPKSEPILLPPARYRLGDNWDYELIHFMI